MNPVTGEFIHDAMHREPNYAPMNHIGCAVVADLSFWLMYGTRVKATLGTLPIWPERSYNPRNRIGLDIIYDDRRTKTIMTCRIGNRTDFLKIS
jgi:hypothetical protein